MSIEMIKKNVDVSKTIFDNEPVESVLRNTLVEVYIVGNLIVSQIAYLTGDVKSKTNELLADLTTKAIVIETALVNVPQFSRDDAIAMTHELIAETLHICSYFE